MAKQKKRVPKDTPSQVAGRIRAGLKAIADPHPSLSDERTMWEFFDSQCAFCGSCLVPGTANAHRDHLVSRKSGGSNHISNRVPACSICNGNDKREIDWRKHLRVKATSEEEFAQREAKIMAWLDRWPGTLLPRAELVSLAEERAEFVIEIFKQSVRELRTARKNGQ